MSTQSELQATIQLFSQEQLTGLLHQFKAGLEREALRISPAGRLSLTPHPHALGSSLTHPWYTTDFSEAQLEIVSPPFASFEALLQHMGYLHSFALKHMGGEHLWAPSMPCRISGEDEIPVALFGSSHQARVKEIYRQGLSQRYGKRMQIISGIHYNFSFGQDFWRYWQESRDNRQEKQAFISAGYFNLMRNYLSLSWLQTYLFGASPAVDGSFLPAPVKELSQLDRDTWYGPYATSLRMSPIGYMSSKQCDYLISYRDLASYLADLHKAMSTPCEAFTRLGVSQDGDYRQLNDHILQIENEYYSLIRAKQPVRPGERPFTALKERGVDYIEVRGVDIHPGLPLGIDADYLCFLRLLLLYCLWKPSPQLDNTAIREYRYNQNAVSLQGRQSGLTLKRHGNPILMTQWAEEIMQELEPIASLLDPNQARYTQVLARQRQKIRDAGLTPSAQVLTEMQDRRESFQEFGLRWSADHAQALQALVIPAEVEAALQESRFVSRQASQQLAEATTGSFSDYLARFQAALDRVNL